MTDQQQHFITPPQWQMDEWQARIETMGADVPSILLEVAQWGYDQRGEVNEAQLQQARDEELEACIDFVRRGPWCSEKLRAARRPKPQTLSSIALQTLDTIERDAHYLPEIYDTIRRAILRLKQLEDSND